MPADRKPSPERFRRLILHIGQTKTGTTSLQHALAANRRALSRAGILYPRTSGWRTAHHGLVAALLGPDLCTPYVLQRMGGAARAEAVAARDLAALRTAAGRHHTLVLSTETLFRQAPEAVLEHMFAALAELADEIRVVAYIRHPADFYLSALNTTLQALQPPQRPHRAARRRTLAQYLDRPGVTVVARALVPATLAGGNVVDDFAVTALGDAALLPRKPRRPLNRSLSAEALVLCQDYARAVPVRDGGALTPRDRAVRELIRRLDRLVPGSRPPRLRDGLAEAVVRETRDLGWLRDRFDCTFPEIDYAVAGTGTDVDFAALTEIAQICHVDAARLARLRRLSAWAMPRAS